MIAVIADDITGAAEIAGIGLRFGLKVSLVTQLETLPDCDLLVYATDTRSMPENEAVGITQKIIKQLLQLGVEQFYKKTDSALRGHIISELKMLMSEIGVDKALLIPQNPSRGRIIKNGIYYINNKPLHHTSFADDPEFPATTSEVTEYLNDVININSHTEITGKGIYIGNASNGEDINGYLVNNNCELLLAGGADLFIGYLLSMGKLVLDKSFEFNGLQNRNSILICGSTVNHSLTEFDYFKRKNVQFCNIPEAVFEGNDPQKWINELNEIYSLAKSIVIQINYPSKGGKEYALRLRNIMADVTYSLVNTYQPQELLIEGGSTAFAILNKLNWTNFHLTNEITPGVVRMSLIDNPDIYITLKPGSYSWGNKIFA